MPVCEICAKRNKVGRNRSHAQNRSPRIFGANIQKVTLEVEGKKLTGKFCSKCIKRLKKVEK